MRSQETGFENLIRSVAEILEPGGKLSKIWPGYEARPGQLLMASAVAKAFATDDILLIEAGTGTGKTMAYLLPALLSQKKTIVSTGTKNLQEQIFHKDIPFIKENLGGGFKAAYLKGRENYLCLHFYKNFLKEPAFAQPGETAFLDRLVEWAEGTMTGDRAELSDLPEDFSAWADISAGGDRCLGSRCEDYQDCFLFKARRQAAGADLLVVNHHLFMADLTVREQGFGEVIPAYEAVIFDEAHQLEDVATQHFGRAVSSWRILRLKHDLERELSRYKLLKPESAKMLLALSHLADRMAKDFFNGIDEIELWATDHPDMPLLKELSGQLLERLDALGRFLGKEAETEDAIVPLLERLDSISRDLVEILDGGDRQCVYWAERRGKGLFLRASPVHIAPYLQENLLEQGKSIVFTSATLTANGSFDYLRERLGLMPEIEGVVVESPFDYQAQTMFYVPDLGVPPNDTQYPALLAEEVNRILTFSRGRAFVLFTSYRNLNYVGRNMSSDLGFEILIQGEAPRTALLDRFRHDIHSVLLATHSFWQGVDVPGESLSAVVIDKIPFPRPDRPLVRARAQQLKEDGQDPFMDYFVPEAIITLKQGLGRLIRSRNDRGLLAVLDIRLVTKGYGKRFFRSLPGSPLTRNPDEVEAFFTSEAETRDK